MIVNELEDDVLVVVEGLDITVQFEEVRGHLVLKVVEFHRLSHLLSQSAKL